jgi:hypothetical protein
MEILKRAKSDNDGDLVPFNADEKDVREEVNRRTYKAGLTNRDGGPPVTGNIRSMPANDKYRENYVKIFGHD